MARLLIHVEGQTEERFVNEVLREHLQARGFYAVSARILGNARQRNRRGGITPWPSAKKDIIRHLQEDSGCIATTMIDFYALPQEGADAWPGRSDASGRHGREKAHCVETALLQDVAAQMGDGLDFPRFVPNVVLHEFEGLLFSDTAAFSKAIDRPDLQVAFQTIRDEFATPEDINDSPVIAPSKRVINLVGRYQKPLLGLRAATEIGLAQIRRECPHFNGWLEALESRCTV